MQPPVIGITGGIGSGKSTIALFFNVLGYPVYYSDVRAKELYFGKEVRSQVELLLGHEAYTGDQLNKKFISEKIFSDRSLLEKMNAIIHPAVRNDFSAWIKRNSAHDFLFKESALLFETGIYKQCFKNILVTAPQEVRVARVMKRDQLTREDVLKKLEHQWKDEDKAKLADLVLVNDGTVLLIPEIVQWMDELKIARS